MCVYCMHTYTYEEIAEGGICYITGIISQIMCRRAHQPSLVEPVATSGQKGSRHTFAERLNKNKPIFASSLTRTNNKLPTAWGLTKLH